MAHSWLLGVSGERRRQLSCGAVGYMSDASERPAGGFRYGGLCVINVSPKDTVDYLPFARDPLVR